MIKRKTPRRKHLSSKSHVTKHAGDQILVFHPHKSMPLPDIMFTTLTQTLNGYVDMTSAGLNSQSFQNSVDINTLLTPFSGWTAASKVTTQTGTSAVSTSAPVGFTTLCNQNLYQAFTVLSSSISVRLFPQGLDAAVDDYMLCITPSQQTTVPANNAKALQQPRTKSLSFSAYAQKRVLKSSISVAKIAGVDPKAIMNDNAFAIVDGGSPYSGTSSSGPAGLFYWVININSVNGAVPSQHLPFEIVMKYRVKFWQFNAEQIAGG